MSTAPLPPVELLLLRHGIAEPRQVGLADAPRALTDAGRRRTDAVLARLRQLDLGAQRLLSSPLVRARQTAELAVAHGLAPALEVAGDLAPDGEPLPRRATWLAAVPPRADGRRRLLRVGHEPDLGDLACALIGAPSGAISLRKAGLAVLRCSGPGIGPGSGSGTGTGTGAADSAVPRVSAQLKLLVSPAILLGVSRP